MKKRANRPFKMVIKIGGKPKLSVQYDGQSGNKPFSATYTVKLVDTVSVVWPSNPRIVDLADRYLGTGVYVHAVNIIGLTIDIPGGVTPEQRAAFFSALAWWTKYGDL